MAQEMYKHDAFLHLLWALAEADTDKDDNLYDGVSSLEDEYYEKIKNAEDITISFSDMAAKRKELGYDRERIINEALKATNGCGREWRAKVYGYMWRMALKSWEGEFYDDWSANNVSKNEYALIKQARSYFRITEDEDDKCIELTKV